MRLLLQSAGTVDASRKDSYAIGRYTDIIPSAETDVINYVKLCMHMNRKAHLYMEVATADSRLLPTADMDINPARFEDGKKLVMDLFDNRGWYFALIQSSPYSFWAVFDYPCADIKHALNFISNSDIKSISDKEYTNCALQAKMFVLRATPKNGFIPHVIKSNMVRQESIDWLEDFKAYWDSPEVQEYVAIHAMNAL